MNCRAGLVAALLLFPCVGCNTSAPSPSPIQTVSEFCEKAPFVETDFAVKWQIDALPEPVEQAIVKLRETGSREHTKYLCYLFLRDYENQLMEHSGGYTLGPALPLMVVREFDRLLQEKGIQKEVRSDWVSSTYATAILDHPDLIAGYAKAEALAARLIRMRASVTSLPTDP